MRKWPLLTTALPCAASFRLSIQTGIVGIFHGKVVLFFHNIWIFLGQMEIFFVFFIPGFLDQQDQKLNRYIKLDDEILERLEILEL